MLSLLAIKLRVLQVLSIDELLNMYTPTAVQVTYKIWIRLTATVGAAWLTIMAVMPDTERIFMLSEVMSCS